MIKTSIDEERIVFDIDRLLKRELEIALVMDNNKSKKQFLTEFIKQYVAKKKKMEEKNGKNQKQQRT